ncbi:MAG: excisionase family DNA binding protein [Lysobacterales bacterium]|jgi:excisionase family DNA binding protein
MGEKPLTPGDVSRYCHVTTRTVNQWITEGKMKAYRTPGNHSRVKVNDFIDFLSEYKMPIPEALKESGKIKVLIVDDDKDIVDSMRKLLVAEGIYEVDVSYDGFSAGVAFARLLPDLVILGIHMSDMNGFEVCRRLCLDSKNKSLKILIISGSIDQEEADSLMKMGANDYLEKPFTPDTLRKSISKLLSKK